MSGIVYKPSGTGEHTSRNRITVIILAALIACFLCLPGCGSGSGADGSSASAAADTLSDTQADVPQQTVTDDYGRKVTIPEEITKIAPSGATAQMFLMTLAPDLLVGLSASPNTTQMPYFPEEMWSLPTFGQFYGAKSTLNMEALMAAAPQLIIDTGDRKVSGKSDLNGIMQQTKIPTVFYCATLEEMPHAYRELGKILGREEEAEELAQFVEKTMAMAAEKSALIPEEDKLRIMYGTGSTGLAVNADESSQAQVIDIIGAKNAIIPDVITDKGGGTIVNMESVFVEDPDVVIFTSGGPYSRLQDSEWANLRCIQNGDYYEIPGVPYNWVSSPPSVNMVLGVWWLGQLVYPEIYNDYDIVEVAQEYYKLFWHYDLSEEEARTLLKNSYFKEAE